MRHSQLLGRLVVGALVALVAAGCSGGDPADPTSTTAPPATSSTSPRPEPSTAAPPTDNPEPTSSDAAEVPKGTDGSVEVTLGDERPATIFVPAGYQEGSPAPLLLLLHGYNGDATAIEEYYQLRPLANEAGLLYAVPEGIKDREGGRFWNAAPVCCDFYGAGVDDSAYLRQLIEEIQARYSVDPRRIFIVGFSNGGYMAHRMACDHADVVTGIVSQAGMGLLDQAACAPAEPVTVLQVHGDADSGVLYEGGSINEVPYPSAKQTVEDWARRNGCSTPAREGATFDLVIDGNLDQPGQVLLEGPETTPASYDGCKPGGHVELWTMAGADHIPGLVPTFGQQVVDFLLAHPRPE